MITDQRPSFYVPLRPSIHASQHVNERFQLLYPIGVEVMKVRKPQEKYEWIIKNDYSDKVQSSLTTRCFRRVIHRLGY